MEEMTNEYGCRSHARFVVRPESRGYPMFNVCQRIQSFFKGTTVLNEQLFTMNCLYTFYYLIQVTWKRFLEKLLFVVLNIN